MSERKITKSQIISCIRYHEEMTERFYGILERIAEGEEVNKEVVDNMMKTAEAKKMTATVKNVPPITEKYVTALPAHGSLWYYGSFKTLEEANAQLLDKEENPDKSLILLINGEVTA